MDGGNKPILGVKLFNISFIFRLKKCAGGVGKKSMRRGKSVCVFFF